MSDPAWMPARFTPALADPITTDGDRLISAVESLWSMPDGGPLQLDAWQRWLLRRVLERYPADWPVRELRGRLRFRQAVISMGRQNGKSLLGAILGFYGLAMHVSGPEVIGLASSAKQANIVYSRVLNMIRASESLTKRFKATGTRGISHRNGIGSYQVMPAKEDALQGIPVSLVIFDELHIAKPDMWGAVVNGQRSRPNALLVGITTAGDDDSELLKRLYHQGSQSVAGELERFGFYCWEAGESDTIETPGAIEAANPAIACGRIEVEGVRDEVRLLPEHDQRRYTLNRFVSSSSALLTPAQWGRYAGTVELGSDSIVTIERTRSWGHATIVATGKTAEGKLATEIVASVVAPTADKLAELAGRIRDRYPVRFAVDSITLGAVGKLLTDRGLDVRFLRHGDVLQAGPAAYARIMAGDVIHAGDPLLSEQWRRAKAKNVGESWRITSTASGADVDAVLATLYGLYLADIEADPGIQVF